jgi:hypothetical protein
MLLIQWYRYQHYFLNFFSNGENPFSAEVDMITYSHGMDKMRNKLTKVFPIVEYSNLKERKKERKKEE